MPKFKKQFSNPLNCPVSQAINILGGKWKPIILYAISGGVDRFSDLQRAIPAISKKVLTSQLRELESDGIITRKVYPVLPPKVEYSISEFGKNTTPSIQALRDLGLLLLNSNKP